MGLKYGLGKPLHRENYETILTRLKTGLLLLHSAADGIIGALLHRYLLPMHTPLIWHPYRPLMQLPAQAKSWLLEQGSLTARLIHASDGHFRVQRIRQQWCVPTPDEINALGLRPREKALIREVFLLCHGEPWVYARTVMPHSSLNGRLRFLRGLRNTSLGSLLFKDPQLQRGRFDITHLSLPHPLLPVFTGTSATGMAAQAEIQWPYAATENTPPLLYGRRSVFRLYRQPLLVAEFFLPACPLYHSEHRSQR